MLQTGNLLMKTTNNYFHSHAPVHLVHHNFLKSGIAYELIDNFIAGGGGGGRSYIFDRGELFAF